MGCTVEREDALLRLRRGPLALVFGGGSIEVLGESEKDEVFTCLSGARAVHSIFLLHNVHELRG